jgi:hypothetical protein
MNGEVAGNRAADHGDARLAVVGCTVARHHAVNS